MRTLNPSYLTIVDNGIIGDETDGRADIIWQVIDVHEEKKWSQYRSLVRTTLHRGTLRVLATTSHSQTSLV